MTFSRQSTVAIASGSLVSIALLGVGGATVLGGLLCGYSLDDEDPLLPGLAVALVTVLVAFVTGMDGAYGGTVAMRAWDGFLNVTANVDAAVLYPFLGTIAGNALRTHVVDADSTS